MLEGNVKREGGGGGRVGFGVRESEVDGGRHLCIISGAVLHL